MEGRVGPAKGKDFDTANAMGRCLITADEIPDPYNLTMIARVTGEEWGRANASSMYWIFEKLIACISRSKTLYLPRLPHGRQRLRPRAFALHQAG
jgi:2-keto-4-pentenoate hydratase/2-oxohepta-3-ene-1,7-dioic acid hydratase in catechol pathway